MFIISVVAIYRWLTKPLNRIKHYGDIGFFVGKVKVSHLLFAVLYVFH